MQKKKMYNLIYRIRKSNTGLRINTRERTIFFDYQNKESIEDRKVNRLRREFHFHAQSEIRS